MPPRWLAPRSRSQPRDRVATDDQRTQTAKPQPPNWNDFFFVDDGRLPPTHKFEDDRPKTSSGASGRSKSNTRPQLGLGVPRPQTSEGNPKTPIANTYSPSQVDGTAIGVAFGSPLHPPIGFFGTLNDVAPSEGLPSNYEDSIFEQPEPYYQIKDRPSKWKKLGFLFKANKGGSSPKATSGELEPFYKVHFEEKQPPEMPIRRSPTPPPKDISRKSLNARLAKARLEVAKLEDIVAEIQRTSTDETHDQPAPVTALRAALPKLDVTIPSITMERYSVLFADVQDAKPPSKLLARRSRTLERLKPVSEKELDKIDETATPDTSTLSPRLAMPRRATSPSSTAKSTGGFFLFPPSSLAKNQRTREALNSPKPTLRRSVTSPARLSPNTETFTKDKMSALHVKRMQHEANTISPGGTTASTDHDAPWSAGDAFLSPTTTVTTIDEEILMTPLKDSLRTGSERELFPQQTFLRSPSAGLANTPESITPIMPTPTSPSDSDSAAFHRIGIASTVFDKAIAEVQALASAASQPLPTAAYVPLVLAPEDGESILLQTEKSAQPPSKMISAARLMMVNMPSPITEAPEEGSAATPARIDTHTEGPAVLPVTTRTRTESPAPPPAPLPQRSAQAPASLKREEVGVLSSFGAKTAVLLSPAHVPAPPVPQKDSKFIPLSRFAVKGTAANVKERSGIKPAPRPVRSTTEPVMHVTRSTRQRPPISRSASDESLQRDITNPIAKDTATSRLEKMGLEKPSVMTVMAVVNPVPVNPGEVGIARTVSLSRKQSQRVLVMKADSAKRERSPEKQAEQVGKRSQYAARRPMQVMKRADSFRRAVEYGREEREQFRAGEERARAMSPVVMEVNQMGHKVVKSHVGVLENAEVGLR